MFLLGSLVLIDSCRRNRIAGVSGKDVSAAGVTAVVGLVALCGQSRDRVRGEL